MVLSGEKETRASGFELTKDLNLSALTGSHPIKE
jgi:hypothetical protein